MVGIVFRFVVSANQRGGFPLSQGDLHHEGMRGFCKTVGFDERTLVGCSTTNNCPESANQSLQNYAWGSILQIIRLNFAAVRRREYTSRKRENDGRGTCIEINGKDRLKNEKFPLKVSGFRIG